MISGRRDTHWRQIRIWINGAESAAVEQILQNCGAASVTILDAKDQPLFQLEPGATPMWDQAVLVGLFAADSEIDEVESLLRAAFSNIEGIEITELADQDWERSWMRDYHPLQFGERLWVCPSWETPPDPDAVNIRLDPGLAFGSGTHATTALCLRWLEQQQLAGKQVIDYGCGSGILAIAAALLGAAQVLAVDNDPQALQATADNRDRNGIPVPRLQVYGPGDLPAGKVQVLLANILVQPLQQLAGHFATLLQADGRLVLSGVLEDQVAGLLDYYRPWFDIEDVCSESGWSRIVATRKDN